MGLTINNVHPSLRYAFHPVCRTSEVVEGELNRVTLLGEDWVLTRIDGEVTAMVDKCPHRHAPLSVGCVVDGTVQCRYHGYRFSADGTCVAIPAIGTTAKIPPKANVKIAHSIVERYDVVWLAPEEPVTGVIDIPEWDDPDFVVVPMPDATWNAGAAQMTENFLDLGHLPFVHLGTFADPDDLEVAPYKVERDGWGFKSDHHHSTKTLEGEGDTTNSENTVGHRQSTWWYEAPFGIRLRIHYFDDDVILTILFCHQPVDENTTKIYVFDLRNDILDGRSTPEEATEFQLAVANEDKEMLEMLTTKSTPLDPTAEVHTRVDRITLEMRRILSDLVAHAANQETP